MLIHHNLLKDLANLKSESDKLDIDNLKCKVDKLFVDKLVHIAVENYTLCLGKTLQLIIWKKQN